MNTRDVQKSLGTFGMGSKRSGSVNLALSKNDNLRPEKLSGNVSLKLGIDTGIYELG